MPRFTKMPSTPTHSSPPCSLGRAEFITAFLKWAWGWALLKTRPYNVVLLPLWIAPIMSNFAGRNWSFPRQQHLPSHVSLLSSAAVKVDHQPITLKSHPLYHVTATQHQLNFGSWVFATNWQLMIYRQRLLDKHGWNVKPYVKITILSHTTCEEKEENMNQISYHYKQWSENESQMFWWRMAFFL